MNVHTTNVSSSVDAFPIALDFEKIDHRHCRSIPRHLIIKDVQKKGRKKKMLYYKADKITHKKIHLSKTFLLTKYVKKAVGKTTLRLKYTKDIRLGSQFIINILHYTVGQLYKFLIKHSINSLILKTAPL